MSADTLQYRTLLCEDLEDVRALMLSECLGVPSQLRLPIQMLIEGGGKRLRPALVLLSSKLSQVDRDKALVTAAAVEMLHTATLIHDDLIDDAAVRRGVHTLNAHWTPTATVLAGDVIFALAAKLIARAGSPSLVQRFAETLETICLGEIGQMFGRNGDVPSIERYYRRIYAKTASLFSLCVESGPVLAEGSQTIIERGQRLGRLIGEAFQIADDVLDLMGTPAQMGKPVGTDLAQGLVTLPVLLYAQAHPEDARLDQVLHGTPGESDVNDLILAIRASDAPTEAMTRAEAHADEALTLMQAYPDGPYRRALEEIVRFAVRRRY